MKIFKFNIILIFIKFILSENNIVEDNNNKFYFEYINSIFYISIIENSVTNQLMNMLPLENKNIQKDDEKILVFLNYNINLTNSTKTTYISKGNILIDGYNLIIYYGSTKFTQEEFFVTIGFFDNIDSFLEILNNNPISNLNFGILCSNTFVINDNITISYLNPSFILFNKDFYDFEKVPNIYIGNNNDPLYKKCKINKKKKVKLNVLFLKKK